MPLPVVSLRQHYPGGRQQQQRQEKRMSPAAKIYIVFVLVPSFFAVWGIGTVYVLVSRHRDDHTVDDRNRLWQQLEPIKDSNNNNFKHGQIRTRRQQQSAPVISTTRIIKEETAIIANDDDDCEIYGCPIYPPEMNDAIVNQTLAEDLKRVSNDPLAADAAAIRPSFFATPTHAMITRQSNQHEFNQDRSVLFTPFLTTQTPRGTKSFLVAILDGHGVQGHVIADYAKHQIPKLLAEKLNSQPCCQSNEWISQQLNATFIETNQHAPSADVLRGGCTASVSLRIGNRLFVANAGDSRTILVKYSYHHQDSLGKEGDEYAPPKEAEPETSLGTKHHQHWSRGNTTIENGIVHEIPYMSRKDKANLPDERARIQALNGTIHIPPHNPNLSRVVVYSAAAQPPENIGLAMSRSIGDWEWKLVGVTAEPIVNVLDLSNYCQQHPIIDHADDNTNTAADDSNSCSLLLIAASDGIWDLRRPEFYAKRFRESFLPSIINSNNNNNGHHVPFHRHLLEACVNMFWQVAPAQAKWYRDDMSVLVIEANP